MHTNISKSDKPHLTRSYLRISKPKSASSRSKTKLAYLEDFVNQLQGVSVVHTKSIDGITAQCKEMSEKLRELADAAEEIPNRMLLYY